MQKAYVRWDENMFRADYALTLPDDENERKKLETKWIALLEGVEPIRTRYKGQTDDFTQAIVGLARMKSPKATELLTKIAGERVFKDNAYRHSATKMLGELGDASAIPDLIPLVYHFNFNTRIDAQISLSRLTGQNFGYDAEAWGKWYNENRSTLGKDSAEFDPTPVDWTFGSENSEIRFYSDPKNQKTTDESWFIRQGGKIKPNVDDVNAPKILKMEPENGAQDVDAGSVTELRLTFDRDMIVGNHSWCNMGKGFPETTDKPKWLDKRTCVLPVKLEPNTPYLLGINAGRFLNFKSADGVSVVPVVYTFKTKEGPAQQKDNADDSKAPKILKMEPENGAKDVDASTVTELRVTFDRDMAVGSHSWCTLGGLPAKFPGRTTEKAWWFDKRTAVLPVKLEPNTPYVLGINASRFLNFKSIDGVFVVPVVYTFTTKEGSAQQKSDAAESQNEDAKKAVEELSK